MAERPVRALKFQGLFGVWSWPLVNILLERLGTSRGQLATRVKGSYSNLEELTIKEMPDGSVRMIVHRKAQRE